jgi:GNAT superfamily N-acetyltransferase
MMNTDAPVIECLPLPACEGDVTSLASLLVDTVESGSAVSFLAPLSQSCAEDWWRKTLEAANDRTIILVARDEEGICGTVQAQPAWAPNQPHRVEIAKLMVHRRCRRAGLGARLMQAIEGAAAASGFTLATLDTRRGDAAERLYLRLGWTCFGFIPDFALNPDGLAYHDDALFYKRLSPSTPTPPPS